jgi:hypothetical protein
MHSGASDLIPIDSSRSDEDPIVAARGAASIVTATGLLATAGAAATALTFGVSVSFASSARLLRAILGR